MESLCKPICLLADSQLLFREENGQAILQSLMRGLSGRPSAVYIGASNGDEPKYYELFVAAMAKLGITHCRMIYSEFSEADKVFLLQADIVLLAGGDVALGWRVLSSSGMQEAIVAAHRRGCILMGISAGAIHLGLIGGDLSEGGDLKTDSLFNTFGLVPYVINVHDEQRDWPTLKRSLALLKDAGNAILPGTGTYKVRGLGIPSGGGCIVYPDNSVSALCCELIYL